MTTTALVLAILAFFQSQLAVIFAYLAFKRPESPVVETWEDNEGSILLSDKERLEVAERLRKGAQESVPMKFEEYEAEFGRLFNQ